MITKVRSLRQFIGSIARGKRGLSPPWNKNELKMKLEKSFWSTHIINSLCNPIVSNLYSHTDTYPHLPIFKRKHDAGMLADSQLLHSLHRFAYNPDGQAVCVHGDPAYPLRVQMQGPFRYGVLTPQMQQYNTEMSVVRSSVEWLFGDVIDSFKFND